MGAAAISKIVEDFILMDDADAGNTRFIGR
jgi:hypothetical protein